jgi:serine/threonine protein kinase
MEIKNYKIKQKIGKGGMATVYLGEHISLKRDAALKIMSPELAANKQFEQSFLKEGEIVAKLEHPNIVGIYDIGKTEDNASSFMAMEYLRGGSLKEKLESNESNYQGLEYQQCEDILTQVGAGLGHAHQHDFVHRDIKPANILFRQDGTAVLTDFGIAKLQDSTGDLTRLGYTLGTLQYMSPEQASTTELDQRSDIYSLGLVFYEMLTGHKAYNADTTAQAIYQHVNEPPPHLPSQYAYLQTVIDKVLAKNPDDRFSTVDEFVNAVKNVDKNAYLANDKTVIYNVAAPVKMVKQTVNSSQSSKSSPSLVKHPLFISSIVGVIALSIFAFLLSSGGDDDINLAGNTANSDFISENSIKIEASKDVEANLEKNLQEQEIKGQLATTGVDAESSIEIDTENSIETEKPSKSDKPEKAKFGILKLKAISQKTGKRTKADFIVKQIDKTAFQHQSPNTSLSYAVLNILISPAVAQKTYSMKKGTKKLRVLNVYSAQFKLAVGHYKITVRNKYSSVIKTISVQSDQTLSKEIILKSKPKPVEEVSSTPPNKPTPVTSETESPTDNTGNPTTNNSDNTAPNIDNNAGNPTDNSSDNTDPNIDNNAGNPTDNNSNNTDSNAGNPTANNSNNTDPNTDSNAGNPTDNNSDNTDPNINNNAGNPTDNTDPNIDSNSDNNMPSTENNSVDENPDSNVSTENQPLPVLLDKLKIPKEIQEVIKIIK